MKPIAFATAALIAIAPFTASTLSAASDASDRTHNPRPGATSTVQAIKNDAAESKRGLKNAVRKLKRKIAVAECNDGRYSYTHHKTCNKHGGIKERLR